VCAAQCHNPQGQNGDVIQILFSAITQTARTTNVRSLLSGLQ
jgi:hypothetical protein